MREVGWGVGNHADIKRRLHGGGQCTIKAVEGWGGGCGGEGRCGKVSVCFSEWVEGRHITLPCVCVGGGAIMVVVVVGGGGVGGGIMREWVSEPGECTYHSTGGLLKLPA